MAWDPKGELVATQSCDRSVRLYDAADSSSRGAAAKGKGKELFPCSSVLTRRSMLDKQGMAPAPPDDADAAQPKASLQKQHKMFIDETVRRLSTRRWRAHSRATFA